MRIGIRCACVLVWLVGCGGADEWTGLDDLSRTEAGVTADVTHFRVMAANLTAGNAQSYDTGEGKRIFQGLRPDIALVQELNVGTNTDVEVRAFVDEAFGPEYFYFREAGAQIPNAVVSRFPILSAGQWNDPHINNRDFAWARIDLPGSRELFTVSIHLSASNNGIRGSQAQALVDLIQQQHASGDYLVVGGDLNTSGGQPITQLGRVVRTQAPAPADARGNINTNATRKKRLDWVLSDAALESMQVPVEVADLEFPNGLVFDSRAFDPLHLVEPVQRSDSGARNMQHMAVMRGFAVPAVPTTGP